MQEYGETGTFVYFGENIKCGAAVVKEYMVPQKLGVTQHFHFWVYNQNKNTNMKRYMCINVHGIIYNCQDIEATSVHQQMNKEDVVQIYNGRLLSHLKS